MEDQPKRVISKTKNKNPTETQKKLKSFINDAGLPAVLARMTAYGGLSFKIYITSQDLRKFLTALGHSVPKFITSIRELVMQYGQQIRQKNTRKLANLKSEGNKFGLTLHEWTSLGNRRYRYLNINVYGRGYLINLGLVRLKGIFTAEISSDAISNKLSEFGLDYRPDIVGIATNGCAMMKKLVRIIPPFQQLCYAHGLQLVLQDIFYRSKPKSKN
ncbi:hypothetical protein LOD99_8004 [Oopsacas minuta]|uniref:DUF659 domain-containing protein n=1 Tax=Oopsacas minuta TaxID=111878 RepID=A0AAV7JI94_9METZ|nr:hypothetical protein LOD99_8004 [Oopsacas minuta]